MEGVAPAPSIRQLVRAGRDMKPDKIRGRPPPENGRARRSRGGEARPKHFSNSSAAAHSPSRLGAQVPYQGSLEAAAKEFAAQLTAKTAALPSQAWKLLHSAKPESVLWVAHTSKNGAVQAKFKGFYTEWAQAKQKLPYVLMQEMRIVPELAGYDELLDKLFFELMDGKLGTVEEMRAYLEPYSPPAPPPPVHLRRPRVAKKEAKPAKSRKKAAVEKILLIASRNWTYSKSVL